MKESKKQEEQRKSKDGEACDVLFGITSICKFLGVSEATVVKWMREYEDFPIKKMEGGMYIGSRSELNKWFREQIRGK